MNNLVSVSEEEFFKVYHMKFNECECDNEGQLIVYTGVYLWWGEEP